MALKKAAAPTTFSEKMHQALALQKAGDIEKAQRLYKSVLKKAPQSADANHLLGVCYRQLGKPERARQYIQKAIDIAPDRAPFYANLARVFSDMPHMEPESVLAVAEKALILDPTLIEARNLKGISLSHMDRKTEAEDIFRALINEHPRFVDAYRNYGILLRDNKDHDKAVYFFDRAAQLDPSNVENFVQRARSRLEIEDFKNSRPELEAALKLFPKNGDLAHEYARLLFKTGESTESLKHAEFAAKNDPKNYHKLVTLGVHYHSTGRFNDAVVTLDKALDAAGSDLPAASWNKALALLAAGRLKEGWALHKARFEDKNSSAINRQFDVPEWDGSPLEGKTIMVWNDQGVGDALRNASMIPEMVEKDCKVIVEAPAKLVEMYERSFEGALVRKGQYDPETLETELKDYDVHCCLTDLPQFIRPSASDFKKRKSPYLQFDRERALELHGRLDNPEGKPVIGVAWRSGSLAAWRSRWYLSILEIKPILETPNAIFVNLQYSSKDKEIRWVREGLGVNMQHFDDLDLRDDMDAAAALTACVDLVISANTSVADLAGALDVPCWRYGSVHSVVLLGQKNPPWYPSMTYYRIPPEKHASDIVPRLVSDLRAWLKAPDCSRRLKRLGLE
ncbi:tetratricopeptide repeat protein [Roseibium sp.]|uniref:tetratricopeptide repeat protein n=1 Tax=Roseibium sp. TaxID=1936156 RepID=UPI003A9777A1